MRNLPWPARLYLGATICAASAVVVADFPRALPNPWLFALLAVASAMLSSSKVRLPLGTSSSNLSVSYTINFAALLLLGPELTMLVAGLSAWTQSTFKTTRRNPAYRTLFNIAVLVLTVQLAGWVFGVAGGTPGTFDVRTLATPVVAMALAYFVLNSGLVAAAVSLSTREPLWRVWQSNFLWTAPSYFVGGAGAAAMAVTWALGWGWVMPLAAAPVYLTFRSYRIYLDRISSEQRHREEVLRLHNKTVEALGAAKASEQRYALAAAGSLGGLWDWDLAANTFYCSERWKLCSGIDATAPIASVEDWFAHVEPDDLVTLKKGLERHLARETPHFEHEYRVRHSDGGVRWMLCRGIAVHDDEGRPVRMAGSQSDITDRRRFQDQLAHAALHDKLTGIANRALFTDLLDRALAQSRRSPRQPFAVLFIDIDHFKLVNDSLGHLVGDQFLVAMTRRFQEHLRPGDVMARLGGDEFAILVYNISGSDEVTAIADRLHEVLSAPFSLQGREIFTSASIGIAMSGTNHASADELLRDADTAMYRAKTAGRSRSKLFDPSMHASAMQRLTLETDLRHAVERREFAVHYQPIVDLQSFEVCGFEALARWRRADGGMTEPSEFIPIAEETGLIAPLSFMVMREACLQVAQWQREFSRPLTLTVNISTMLFDAPTLVDEVRRAIAESGLLEGTLRLEITESFLVSDSDAVSRRLDELRSIPVELYLDDFGTGFSSLSYLHRYRLDALKIDQSFISRIGGLHNDSPIVRSIVTLARELGMGVIAEGVETAQQAQQLMALDCPHAQGYLFSEPLPHDVVHELLAKGTSFGSDVLVPRTDVRIPA